MANDCGSLERMMSKLLEFIISVCQMKWLLVEAENFDTVNEILKIHIFIFQFTSGFRNPASQEHDLFIFAPYVSH